MSNIAYAVITQVGGGTVDATGFYSSCRRTIMGPDNTVVAADATVSAPGNYGDSLRDIKRALVVALQADASDASLRVVFC